MINRRPLMAQKKSSAALSIRWSNQKELQGALKGVGVPYTIDDSILLDAAARQTDGEDSTTELLPLFVVAVDTARNSDDVWAHVGETLNARFFDFRRAFLSARGDDAELLARAQSLVLWSRSYRFCPQCTKPLTWHVSRASAECKDCARQYYPQVRIECLPFLRYSIGLPSAHMPYQRCRQRSTLLSEVAQNAARRLHLCGGLC